MSIIPTYIRPYCLQEKPRIPACGVVLYMEVGNHQTKGKRKKKKEKISFRIYTGYTKYLNMNLPPPVLVRGKGKERKETGLEAVLCCAVSPSVFRKRLQQQLRFFSFAKQKPR